MKRRYFETWEAERGTDAATHPVTPRTLPPDDSWYVHIRDVALPAAERAGNDGLADLYRRILAERGMG